MSTSNTWASYWTRVIPAGSVCGIAILLVCSFLVQPYGKGEPGRRHGAATVWQFVLGFYTVALHILSILFPARVCYALGHVIKEIKENAALANDRRYVSNIQTVETEKGTTPAPLFVILLPAYKEDMGTLEETLRVLASHAQARHCYHVSAHQMASRRAVCSSGGPTLCKPCLMLTRTRYTWQWRRRKRSRQ